MWSRGHFRRPSRFRAACTVAAGVLTLDAPVVGGSFVLSCRIDGMTAGYEAVFDAIHSAWLHNGVPNVGLRLTPG